LQHQLRFNFEHDVTHSSSGGPVFSSYLQRSLAIRISEDFDSYVHNSKLLGKDEEITEEVLDSEEFNTYVKETTNFKSWNDMLENSVKEYLNKTIFD